MNIRTLPAVILFLCSTAIVLAQPVLIKRDNGARGGVHSTLAGYEESVILVPTGPCRVLAAHIYMDGSVARRDTLWIVGDPSEGSIPPTRFVRSYNALTAPIVVDYDGVKGWDTIDLRDRNIRSDGYDRIVIQHDIQAGGPFFAYDNNSMTGPPYGSFLFDPVKTNTSNFPGVYYLANGDFLVRILVEYDFPNGQRSQPPPAPTLVNVSYQSGLRTAAGDTLKASRISVVDFDGDGLDDIAVGSQFFRNRNGMTFEEVSTTMNIAASATVWGDYDNDGHIDCYAVNGGAGDRIYRNNGNGTFTDVTAGTGISNPSPTVAPIWFEANGDGHLDLFIANGRTEGASGEEYFQDRLWLNNGDGTFRDATAGSGIPEGEPAPYFDCWGAGACDYNNDGRTDIFVATYRLAPDRLYRNNGDGTFTEVSQETGVIGNPTAEPAYFGHGIGCDWGDYDNDGNVDLAVGNLGHPDWRGLFSNPSLIFHNDGNGVHFTEMHQQLGLKFFEMNAGIIWSDLDLDGYLDLWQSQYSYSAAGVGGEPRRLSRLYINSGPSGSYRMIDRTWETGALVHGAWTVSQGDFDRDGDPDLVAASQYEGIRLFRNDLQHKGEWIGIRVAGDSAHGVNADGYGTRVAAHVGTRTYYRDLQGGGGGATATQESNEMLFGLGRLDEVEGLDSIVVRFEDGKRIAFTELTPGAHYTLGYDGSVTLGPGSGVAGGATSATALTISNATFDGVGFRLDISAVFPATVEVYDAGGSRIASTRTQGTRSVRVVPRSTVASGLYILRVYGNGATAVAKVAVTR
jgi:hypothetical protein